MKKWQKSIILSASLLTPIIPTAVLLSSCSTTNSSENLSADWTTSFKNIKNFTGVTSVQELIENLSSNTIRNTNSQFLKKVCTVLNISVLDSQEVRLLDNKIIQKNNSLFFTLIVGINLDDNNQLNIKKYSSAITGLDENIDNPFSTPLLENDLVNSNEFSANEFYSIYGTNLVNEKQSSLGTTTTSSKYTSDSKIVQDYLNNNDELPYSLSTNENDSGLKKDLKYFIKESFFENFENWKIPSFELSKYNNFASIKISDSKTKNDGSVDVEICLQTQNKSNSNKIFKFLSQEFNLIPNQVLTIKTTINNISRTDLLEVDYEGYIGLNLKGVNLKSQLSGNLPIEIKDLNLRINRSYSINTKLLNVTGNNNPFNANTIKNFNEIFEQQVSELSNEKIKERVIKKIQYEFDLKKQETLINSQIIEKFAIPAIYGSDLGEYDKNGDGIYSLFDLLANLGKPLSDWYRLKGLPEAADIIENIFSDKPFYLAFHDLFESLIKLLRTINSDVVQDILDFIEQSLTMNGQVKSEAQFREFFVNISNLKEVITPLLVNSGSISGYQLESILKLLDTLANPDQNIWMWISNNFNSILDIVNMFLSNSTLPDLVKNLVTDIGKIEISYNNQKVNNILTDIPLYNFLSREGLTFANPLSITVAGITINASLLSESILNTLLGALNLKEADIISSIGRMFIKQLLRVMVGQSSKITVTNWENAFKSFWIPKQLDGTTNNKTMYEIINEYSNSYKLKDIVWTSLDANLDNLSQFTLNDKLSFVVDLPNLSFDLITTKTNVLGNVTGVNTTTKSLSNVKYNYYFPSSSVTPFIRNVDNKALVDISIPNYINTDGVCVGLTLSPQSFDFSNITDELTQDDKFKDYSSNVYDEGKILVLTKENVVYNPTISSSDLISVKDNGLTNYRFLTNSGYKSFIDKLKEYSPSLDLNDITLKPSIYILYNKPVLGKATYTVYMNFPIIIPIKEYNSSSKTEEITFKNTVSFKINVQ